MKKYEARKGNMNERNKGITLMTLVITVIVLLILATITISAISGNNIITGTINAREKAEIDDEIKLVGIAVNQAKNVNKYGDLEEKALYDAINASIGRGKTEIKYYKSQRMYSITFKESNRVYQIYENGYARFIGKLDDAIMISANPDRNRSLNSRYEVNITVESFVRENIDGITEIKYKWDNSEEKPEDYGEQLISLKNDDSDLEKVTENPIILEKNESTPSGLYYLHIEVTKENGEKEERTFGPYALGIAKVQLAIDPNGGGFEGKKELQIRNGEPRNTTEIENAVYNDDYIIKFDTGEEIKTGVSFVEWKLVNGVGKITKPEQGFSTYTFGNSEGRIVAQYRINGITLPNGTKEGNTIEGWYKDNKKVGEPGDVYTPEYSKDKTGEELEARWNLNKYTLTYNYAENGGENSSKTNEQIDYGTEIDLTKVTATKDGYTFVGWNTDKNATTAQTTKLTMTTEGVTVYAIFKKDIEFTFQYANKKDGNIEATNKKLTTTIYNKNTGTIVAKDIPTLSDIQINGTETWKPRYWTTSESANGEKTLDRNVDLSGINAKTPTTYYARYYKEVTVTYNLNGGKGVETPTAQKGNAEVNSKDLTNIKGADIQTPNITPTKEGYTFNGWNTKADGTGTHIDKNKTGSFTENTTLYAEWNRNGYTATFDGNGGSNGKAITKPYEEKLGDLPTSTREGYTFKGWYTSKTGGTKVTKDTTMPAQNVTYFAQWETVSYTITYDLNGGKLTTKPNDYTIESETFTLPQPTKEGFTFTGWTGSNGTTPEKEVTIEKGTTENKNYTANYTDDIKPAKPTVVANYNSGNATYTSGTWANKQVYTTITSTDAGSGVKEIQYSKDNGKTWTKLALGKSGGVKKDGDNYYGQENWSATNGRDITILFRVIDDVGNISDASEPFNIKYDTAKPTITADNIEYGETLSIRLQDALSGVVAWQVNESTTEPTTGWTTITSTKDTTVTKTGLAKGTYYIWAKDEAGNITSKEVIVTGKKITAPTASNKTYTGVKQIGVAGGTGYTVTDGEKIDAGTYIAKAVLTDKTNTTWSDGTTTDKNIEWKIAQKEITVTWGTTTSWVYDGNSHAPTVTTPVNGVNNEKINLKVEGQKTNVGTDYTATASMVSVENGQKKIANYKLKGDTKKFSITNATITGTLKITGTNTYGSKLTANISGLNPSDAELTYQWYSNDNNSTTGGTPISGATSKDYTVGKGLVGKYIYVVVIATKENYADKTFTDITDSGNNTTETVSAKKITAPTASNKTYSGVEQTGVATKSGYNVTDGAKIDAGNYTAKVVLEDKDNTVWSDGTTADKSINWTIAKKQVAVEWKEPYKWIYDGKSHVPALKNSQINGVNNEKINLTVKGAGTAVNNYTATAEISSVTGGQANKNNYQLTENTKAFEITEAVITGSVNIIGTATYGEKLTAKVEDLSPSDANLKYQWFSSDTKGTTGGTALTEVTTNNTYTVGKGLVGKYIYVVVTASKENFEDKTFTDITDSENNTTEKVAAKKIIKPTAKTGLIYTGLEQTGVTGTSDYTVTNGAKIDAKDYTATVTLKDKNNTVWADTNTIADKSINWTIAKKEIAIEWNDDNTFIYNGNAQGPALKNTQVNGVNNEKINLIVDGKEIDAGNYTATANIDNVTGGQANNNNYKLTGNTKNYEITKADNTIKVTAKTIYTGTTLNLANQVSNAVGTVTYKFKSNGTTTESTLSGSTLTAGAMSTSDDNNQSVIITVNAEGDKNHNGGSKELTITVKKYTRTLTFTKPTTDKLAYNATTTAEVSVTGTGGTQGTVSYASDNTSVIICSGTNGTTLKALKGIGEATITATLSRTATVKQAKTTKKITAQKIANTLKITNKTVKTGKTINLADQVSDAQGSVHYEIKTNGTTTSSTLDGSSFTAGAMSGTNDNNQTVIITVTADGNDNYEIASKELTITVEKYTRTIKFAGSVPDSIKFNGTATAKVDITGEGGTQGSVTYTSSNTNVIVVNGTTLKAVASSGKSTITAKMARTTTVEETTATKEIEAGKDGNRMEVSKTELTVKTLSVTDLSTLVSKADGTVEYTIKTNGTTSKSSISGSDFTAGAMSASNDNDQKVVVTITAKGTSDYGEKSIDVTITVQKFTNLLTFTAPTNTTLAYGKTTTVTATPETNGGTNGAISYTSATPEVISINGTTIKAEKGNGSSVITASMARTTTVKPTTKTITITAKKAEATNSVKITGTNTYGSTLTATITTNSDGTKKYQWFSNTTNSTTGGTALTEKTTTNTYKIESGLAGKYIYVVASVEAGTNWNAAKDATDITDSTNTTATVDKKTLTVASFTYSPITKAYNGNTNAPSGFKVTATSGSGLLSGDIVTVEFTGAVYNDKNVNKATTIKVTGMSISGTNANDYKLNATSYDKTGATITKIAGTNSVKITGTNKVGNILKAEVTTNSDGKITYQWWTATSGSATTGTAISGATEEEYTLTTSEKGKYVGVTVKIAAGTNWNAPKDSNDITDESNNGLAMTYVTITYKKGTGVSSIGKTTENVTGSTTLPTITALNGYTKDGWYNGSTKVGAEGASYTPTNNITLTAKATLNTYTISYTLNGGSVSGNPTSYTVESNEMTLTNPTKTGWTFTGWSGTGLTGNTNTTVKIAKGSTGNRTYIAHFSKTITLTQKHGTSITTQSYALKDSETSHEFTLETSKDSFNGWTFKGWLNDVTPKAPDYQPTGKITISADKTVYATYSKDFTATFIDYNGTSKQTRTETATAYGNNKAGNVDNQYASVKIPTQSTYTGWTSKGWTTKTGAAESSEKASGASITVSSNVTYYGLYEQSVSLTYNANGGSSTPAKQTGIRKTNSNSISTYDNPSFTLANAITRNGYNFGGWTISAPISATKDAKSSITPTSGTALTATAKWDAITYTISYTLNGGTNGTGNPTSYTIESNDITLADPTKTGYTFTGWTTEGVTTPTKGLKITKGSTGNKTYTANFTINNPATPTISGAATKIYGAADVTLTAATTTTYASGTTLYYSFGYATTNGGTPGNWTEASTSATYKVGKTAYVGDRYWSCRVYATDGTQTSNTVASATSADALVRHNNATLTFDATTNGGTLSGTSPLYTRTGATGVYTGIRNSTAGTIPTATKEGYTFNGWYTAATNGSKVLNADGTLTGTAVSGYSTADKKWVTTANKTLYAQWTYIATPTITRKDYNTFTVSATGGSKYIISKTQTTAPTASTSGWATTTSKDASTSAKETWYVWVQDENGNISPNHATITNYAVTLTAEGGTKLSAKADTTSGATVTSGMYVLNGTPVYPTGTLNAGYRALVIKKGSTEITSGSKQTISGDTTFTTSATANKVTITINDDGAAWKNSGIKVDLYKDGKSVISKTATGTNVYTVELSPVANGTYDVYAGKHSGAKTTLIDSGLDITVSDNDKTGTLNYYSVTLAKGTGISGTNQTDYTGTGKRYYLYKSSGTQQDISINATVSAGYTWSTWTKTGTDLATFTAGTKSQNIRMGAGAVTLTASATANTYTISYDYAGGTGGTNKPTSGTYDTDVQISNPTKTGYTFAGWTSSSSDGLGENAKTGTAANPSTAWTGTATKNTYFKNLTDTNNGTVKLTATWTANKYTVEYYQGNNSTTAGSTKFATTSSHTYGTASALKTYEQLGGTAPSGWTFAGWSTSETGTAVSTVNSVSLTDGASVTNLTNTANGTVKLYAIFKKDFTVKSGANGVTSSTLTQYYNPYKTTGYLTTLTLPKMTAISKWTALGYRDDTTAGNKEVTASTTATGSVTPVYNATATTYYGVYSKVINVYSGVSKGTNNKKTQYLNSNGNKVSSISLAVPTEIENWTAIGYRDDTTAADKETAVTTSAVSVTPAYSTSAISYYAVYSRTLTIKYNGNGATSGSTASTTKTVYLNTNSTTTSSQQVTLANNGFIKNGYEFYKWAEGSTSGNKCLAGAPYTAGLAYDASSFEVTMYALWVVPNYQNTNTSIYYETLASALSEVANGQTIKALKGITETTAPSLASGKTNVTIDLNGKTTRLNGVTLTNAGTLTISGAGTFTTSSNVDLITNSGTLTLNHTGTISSTSTGAYHVVKSTGTLNVTGTGTVTSSTTSETIKGGNINISNGLIKTTAGSVISTAGTFNMTGGKVRSEYGMCVAIDDNGTATVTGGTIERQQITSGNWIFAACLGLTGSASADLSGGTIQIYDGNGSNVILNAGSGTLTVSGATVQNLGNSTAGSNAGSGKLVITSGTLTSKGSHVLEAKEESTGTIEVRGGQLSTTGTGDVYVIDNKGEGSNVIVTGGTLTTNAQTAIRSISTGTVTIGTAGSTSTTSPSITGRIWGDATNVGDIIVHSGKITATTLEAIRSKGNITINGGDISSTSSYAAITDGASTLLKITGGTIASSWDHTVTTTDVEGGNIQITGGTITNTNANTNGRARAVNNKMGTTTITGGTIASTNGEGVYFTTGSVTIGTAGSTSTTSPSITGRILGEATTAGNIVVHSGKITATSSEAIRSNGNITINGGDISATSSYAVITDGASTLLKITGGTIASSGLHTVTTTDVVGGNIQITGGTITNTNTTGLARAINNHKGITTITGGNIVSTNGVGVYSTTGTVTLGQNEETPSVSTTVPSITGGTYGVQVTEGRFNFYDGKITGPINNSMSKYPNEIPVGYGLDITKSGSTETATLHEANYQVSSPYLATTTIESALSVANEGATIKMLRSLTDFTRARITKNVTLDLNGNTLTRRHCIEVSSGDFTLLGKDSNTNTQNGVLYCTDDDLGYDGEDYAVAGVGIWNSSGSSTITIDNGAYMKCADIAIRYEGVGLTSDQYTRNLYIKNSWVHTFKEKNALYISNSHVITIDNSYVYMPYASKNLIYVSGKLDWMTVTGKSRIGGGNIQTSDPQSLIYYDNTYTGILNIQMLQNAILMGGSYTRSTICTARKFILRFLDESEIYNNYNNSNATCIRMEGNSSNSQIDVNTKGWLYSYGSNVINSNNDFTFNYTNGSFAQKGQYVDNKNKVKATTSRNRYFYIMNGYNSIGGKQATNMYFRGSGWVKDGETDVYSWKYFNSDGTEYNGLYHSNHYYYLENSNLYLGWKQVGSDWYYFQGDIPNNLSVSDPIYGSALEGGPYILDGKKYIFGSDGKMLTGWAKGSDGYWYYLNPEESTSSIKKGEALKGWRNINGAWYYMNDDYHMITGGPYILDGEKFIFGSDGKMLTGWAKGSDGYWYYLNPKESTSSIKKGEALKGWYWDESRSHWYYLEQFGDGFGQMIFSTSRVIDGKTYNFAADGHCINP